MAHINAQKGKGFYKEVQEINKNPDEWLYNLQDKLMNKTYQTGEYEIFLKTDGVKPRLIYKLPYFPDRICHWAIIQQAESIFINKLNHCTHSAIPDRGIHSAFKQVDNFMKDADGTKFCLKFDIKKFYPSIRHDLLKEMYRGIFKDKDLLWLLDEIIDSIEGGRGVAIGNYLSQYSGNLFLYKFDRWIKEELKVKYYSRYMDDCCIFHHNKKHLHDLLGKIREYLSTNLDLEIKGNYQIFPSRVRGIDFVGYRHFGEYVLLRKSTAKNLIRKMRNIKKKMEQGGTFSYSDYCSINSYKGWIKWCNGYNLYKKWIKPLEPYQDQYYREVIKGENIPKC